MRGRLNDCVRFGIGVTLTALGPLFGCIHAIRIATAVRVQKRLTRVYGITSDTPILSYGSDVERMIRNAAARHGCDAVFAETSGSTGAPKRILYTGRRLRMARWTFIDAFVRCYRVYRIRRKALYVFSAFGQDKSLTSLLTQENRLPPYTVTLQAPYRIERHPSIQDLSRRYGATAVRLWILTIANPGVLYSTNPSTLWSFLHETAYDWPRSQRLVRDYQQKPETFGKTVHIIARRLDSKSSGERLSRVAAAQNPLPMSVWAPAVEAYVCWTGGHVKPFLDRIAALLPPDRYKWIPMYSMSTETIETISHFNRIGPAFLPLASRVLYEFIEEGAVDRPENLRTPQQLELTKSYVMVVSDPFGLRRYQTEDVFRCVGFVGKLPDLRFLRRRNLEYSFTGEKVSAEQLERVFQQLRDESGAMEPEVVLTCVPSHPSNDPIPHYKLVLAGGASNSASATGDNAVAERCDAILREVNAEYRSKRESGRLGPIRAARMTLDEFAARFSGFAGWENQFKFLPLYRHTWEETMSPSTRPRAFSHASHTEDWPEIPPTILPAKPGRQPSGSLLEK